MIYFNNAATTWPKPEEVYRAADACLREPPGGMRSASKRDVLSSSRETIAGFLGIADASRLLLLPGCTYGLNLAILGQEWREGDVAVMSGLEHHAVSRPLRMVAAERGVRLEIAPYREGEPIDLGFLESVLRKGRVRLVACTHASNVTGEILPAEKVVSLARAHGALCLIDAAQTVGILPVKIAELGADIVSFAGHKGLFGPPGVGGLYVGERVSLRPLAGGGTGQDSGKHEIPRGMPYAYEVGTHNVPAIAGLGAGTAWVQKTGLGKIRTHEHSLTERALAGLEKIDGVRVYGARDASARTSVISMTFARKKPSEVGSVLAAEHGVVMRYGYHCAPLAHESIGTLPGDGTLRMSVGYFNTAAEVDRVLGLLAELV